MKFFGVGTDIVNVNRISKSIKKVKFLNKVFDTVEIKKCKKLKNASNCYAKRFAAKEAFSKAIGLGISQGIKFNEIIVHNNKYGKPSIKLIGKTKKITLKSIDKKRINIFLSLTDDKPFAIATVVITS
tara:strand:- start:303 stop:686 length:384 start_codon:yes stop_codon:yes gene_type:complete